MTRAVCIGGLGPGLSAVFSLDGFHSSAIVIGTVTRTDFQSRLSPSAGQHRDTGRVTEGKTSLRRR